MVRLSWCNGCNLGRRAADDPAVDVRIGIAFAAEQQDTRFAVELQRRAYICMILRRKQRRQSRAAGLAGDDRRIAGRRLRQAAHRGDGVSVVDRHRRVAAGVQDLPRELGDLAARQPGHHGVERAVDHHGAPRREAAEDAIGLQRFDHDALRAPRAPVQPEMRADRRRQRTDARRHEHVGRRLEALRGELRLDLGGHHAVAVHDIARDVAVAGIRGVGDDGPAFGGSGRRGGTDGVVVVARNFADLGAVAGDGVAPALADVLVNEDHAAATEQARAPGDRAPVVAVGGASDRRGTDHGRRLRRTSAVEQVARAHARRRRTDRRRDFLAQQVGHRVGAAERLEALEPVAREAAALVLVPQLGEAERARQAVESQQRRRGVARPARDFRKRGGERGCIQHGRTRVAVGCLAALGGRVAQRARRRGHEATASAGATATGWRR